MAFPSQTFNHNVVVHAMERNISRRSGLMLSQVLILSLYHGTELEGNRPVYMSALGRWQCGEV
jgi:hypothetical protein